MTNDANNILRQANQGSVAAIIQILNEKLASSGVRTRAIFDDGVLQLLCEAETLDQLEPTHLVERIRHILDAIAPRNIRRVNINSRIVREQQLLWLEEIKRDPENQLLWSQEITLKKPNPFQQILHDWKSRSTDSANADLPKLSPRRLREQRLYWRGLLGGAGVSLLIFLIGWVIYNRLMTPATPEQAQSPTTTATNSPASQPTNPTTKTVAAAPTTTPAATTSSPAGTADPFAAAVRMAEQASREGLNAKSSAEWLELAARWQQASDLMSTVPNGDSRYKTAQDRVIAYQKNSEAALQEAEKRKATSPPNDASPSDQGEQTQ